MAARKRINRYNTLLRRKEDNKEDNRNLTMREKLFYQKIDKKTTVKQKTQQHPNKKRQKNIGKSFGQAPCSIKEVYRQKNKWKEQKQRNPWNHTK